MICNDCVLYKGHGFKDSKTMSFIKDVPYKEHDSNDYVLYKGHTFNNQYINSTNFIQDVSSAAVKKDQIVDYYNPLTTTTM